MWWRWQDKDFESAIATLEAGIQAWHKQAYPYAEKEQPFGMLRREDILEAVRMLPGNEDLPEWKDMD
ncbi:MAG: hypothetical protein HWN68_18050, partial [Desulfobacterales bacterium]|nr:hypothetical protein [Desulfobacterales bacterium]